MASLCSVTIELCKEDRDRLDQILELLRGGHAPVQPEAAKVEEKKVEEAPAEAPPWEPAAPDKEEKPAITLDQIRQRVTLLRASGTPEQKEGSKNIILGYANNITSLPADKWPEIWDKLTALGDPI